MIFYGWGKDFKPLAFAGIEKCPNCKLWTEAWICEHASYASLYFIKFAKWNKKTCVMCKNCNQGFELPEDQKNSIIRNTINLPSNVDCWTIWKKFEAITQEVGAKTPHLSPVDRISYLKDRIIETANGFKMIFDPNHVDYVVRQYVKFFLDSITTKETS